MIFRSRSPEPKQTPALLPRHIAIIMDGNGRWAAKRGFPRALGHRAGVQALRRCVREAGRIGIPYLTMFGFSAENWKRPPSEVAELMGLMRSYIRDDLDTLHANGVHIRVIGRREGLDPDILQLLDQAQSLTRDNTKMTLVIAFNYGGQDELVDAARRFAMDVCAGKTSATELTRDVFASYLCTAGIPDPDLLIRTSGEMRLSNFLIWQAAYAELVFVEKNWPDFAEADLHAAIAEFARRDRRFGGVAVAAH